MSEDTNTTVAPTEVPALDLSKTPDEIDQAARIFSVGVPRLKKMVDALSLKSTKRVIKALVEFPLQSDEKEMLVHKEEKQVFELALGLMDARSRMIEYTFKERQKMQEQKQVQETKEEVKEGETNGEVS